MEHLCNLLKRKVNMDQSTHTPKITSILLVMARGPSRVRKAHFNSVADTHFLFERELWKQKRVFWPDSYKNTKTALSTLAPDIL